MESPLRITIPRNEITILALSLVLSIIYNAQSGIGLWGTISLVSVLAVLILGSVVLMNIINVKSASLFILVVFLFTVAGIMIAYNFIFYNKLPKELREGYWTPILTTSIFHGILVILSLVVIVLLSTNVLELDNMKMGYFDNAFSVVITLVLLNAGLMAGA